MGALEVDDQQSEEKKKEEGRHEEKHKERDVEKGEVLTEATNIKNNDEVVTNGGGGGVDSEVNHASMSLRLNPTNPLRIVVNGGGRGGTGGGRGGHGGTGGGRGGHGGTGGGGTGSIPTPSPSVSSLPRFTPTPQASLATLNSRRYTNRISLSIFALHMVLAIVLVCFLLFKGVQGLIDAANPVKRKEIRVLKYFLPQVEASLLLSITLAFAWQKAVRQWPKIMVHVILWTSFFMALAAGILLICFEKPATAGLGVCFIAFAIGNGLYACWVSQRIGFCSKILIKSLEPVPRFGDLNQPTYWMLGIGFLWMSIWILAVIGALNFKFPPLTIIALVLSLMWTTEVMRNVVNLTVSRVIALYYLRGMQSSPQFSFQRALTQTLGSACLGSLFVPTIEFLRIVARGLNLLEGEDEFMFFCAHCCLRSMQTIFRYGNGWAFVQIAAYGKGFVQASQDTWQLFERQDMVNVVDSDITSAVCFLTGVCSGSMCTIFAAAWTAKVHQPFTATLSLLAFFIGYLMTRIAMAVPHACVSCYFVCYAENPENRLFDKTIKDRQALIMAGRDVVVPTPRVPRRFTR